MSAQQRHQNRQTARALAQEVFEANLPAGLTLHGHKLYYECPGCGGDSEWLGTPADFEDPSSIKACGGSQWCRP